jgi:hypothetical protein
MFDAKPVGDGPGNALSVPRCGVDGEHFRQAPSCSKDRNPFTTCTPVNINITAGAERRRDDRGRTSKDGKLLKGGLGRLLLRQGDFGSDVRPSSTTPRPASSPIRSTNWIAAPPDPGLSGDIWAVVHDARGGVTTRSSATSRSVAPREVQRRPSGHALQSIPINATAAVPSAKQANRPWR